MDGQGEFKHANGRRHIGLFKRNYYLLEKCFINPLDDEKRQKKNIKIFEEQIIGNKEKEMYDKRIRLFKVHSDEGLKESILESK